MNREIQESKEFVLPAKGRVQIEQIGGVSGTESGGEFTLPDYLPKIQKVLRTESRALPPTRYLSANEAQWSGDVLHTLIYVGEDGELGATVLPSKYACSTPLSPDADAAGLIATVQADTPICRIREPRKVSLRTRVSLRPHGYLDMDVSENVTSGKTPVYTLYGEGMTLRSRELRLPEITVSDVLDGEADAEARPIWCGATAAVTDARATDGGVNVRGEVLFKVLVAKEKSAKMQTKKCPFEEFLEGDVGHGDSAIATATVLSCEVGREPGSDRLLADAALAIMARATTQQTVSLLSDVYSSAGEGSVTYRTVPTERLLLDRSGVYSMSGSLPQNAAGAFGAQEILDTSGKATVEDVQFSGGKVTVSGRCDLQSIYKTADGFSSGGYTLPFRITLDAETPNNATAQAEIALHSARARLEGDALVCDMELALALHATEHGETSAVETADFANVKPYAKSGHALTLLFPDGQSLWEIAKVNHVAPEKLAAVNGLSLEERRYADRAALAGVKTLLIEQN